MDGLNDWKRVGEPPNEARALTPAQPDHIKPFLPLSYFTLSLSSKTCFDQYSPPSSPSSAISFVWYRISAMFLAI
ncbi:hypothetical protein QVD17_17383 [Tagetes erecta]|uniref:Uncharacterized protein n=1 Tax=Tagetes erecta TaxID=13708 RepID=A0AAD8KYA0_TARER|nr:hypothetical protein QVD17_17383 [Tagetes erecta]